MNSEMDMPEGQPIVFAFDFDGVICDSVGENFITTWRALRAADANLAEDPPSGLRERFIECRPAIETGYQNIPLMNLLLDDVTPDALLAEFDGLIGEWMRTHGVDDAEMIRRFGESRAIWQAADNDAWFDAQGFFPHSLAPVNGVADRAIIATTKQNEFACKLVERAGLRVPLTRVYGLERLGPQKKRFVLDELLRRNPNGEVHFFEDRIRTLQKLHDLPRTHLHLVDWGYNLAGDRDQAEESEFMDLLTPATFAALLEAA
jgi:hypothetical protein